MVEVWFWEFAAEYMSIGSSEHIYVKWQTNSVGFGCDPFAFPCDQINLQSTTTHAH